MEKDRFFYLKRRSFNSCDKTYYVIECLDIIDAVSISVFTDKPNFDYFANYNIMDDISPFIEFQCNNNNGLYRPTIKRKE